MTISRRALLGTATAAAAVPLVRPRAQGAPTIKIGVLNDMSGPYLNTGGPTSVVCCKQALEDFGVSGTNAHIILEHHDHVLAISENLVKYEGNQPFVEVETAPQHLPAQAVAKGIGVQLQTFEMPPPPQVRPAGQVPQV